MAFNPDQQNNLNLSAIPDPLLVKHMDEAIEAIGVAETKAEEALQKLKLKNLETLQKKQEEQIWDLADLEDKLIRELAAVKQTLSSKQLAALKAEIQNELRFAREEANKLLDEINKKTKENSNRKSNDAIVDQGSQESKSTMSKLTDNQKKADKVSYTVNIDSSSLKDLKAIHKPLIDAIISLTDVVKAFNPSDFVSFIKNASAASAAASQTGTTDDIKAEAGQRARKGSDSATPPINAGAGTPKNTPEKNFSSDASGLEKVKLDTSELKTAFLNDFSSVLNSGDLVKAIKQINTTVKSYKSYTEQRTSELLPNLRSANAEKLKGFDPKVAMEKAKQAEQEAAKAASEKAYKKAIKNKKTEEEAKADADKAGKKAGDKARKASLKKTSKDYKALSDLVKKEQNKAEKKAIKEAKKAGLSAKDIEKAGKDARKKVTQESVLDANAKASAKLTANFELLADASGNLAKQLDGDVKKISAMQGIVDTRLQGSQQNERWNFSYWNRLLEEAKYLAGASPFIKQEKLVDNIKALVDKGISSNIKERAFLMTIQEKIANTFNVADGTLLRLIRIQQQDTTAGRLGMESALNSFLNSMYETSEYLESVAANVRSSLEEMQALMEGAAGTELEFQVQKWMGSLYSVGMSDSVVQDIAKTFGQIASGDVSGLTGSGTGNLLIMAANEAGMSIADILQEGLNADETNKLMQAMVNYLAEIAETSSDSKVVQQQLANVYGMKASDLRAATNLASSIKDVSNQDLTYGGMLGQLEYMMNTLRFRTSIGEGMTNMWDNVMYSMASTQASNPMLYALPKIADLLRDVTGRNGIATPFLNVFGSGVDLKTSVADLMSVASLAGTALGSIGPLFVGLTDLVNPLVGSTMLWRAGIDTDGKAPVIARGSAQPLQHLGGSSTSESGHIVGNGSDKDVLNAVLGQAEDDKKKQMVEAKDEESSDDMIIRSQQAIIDIYNLLEEVAHGSQSLRVRVVNNNGGATGGQTPIGDNTGVNTTGAGIGNGTDNGNWVSSF